MKSILCASLALVAGVAFAEEIRVSQNFDGAGDNAEVSSLSGGNIVWAGNGKIKTGTSDDANTHGRPVAEATSGQKYLVVDGTVACSNNTTAVENQSYSKADFLLFVDEAGDDPEDVIAGAQIAVAAGEGSTTANANDSYIWIYCCTNVLSASSGWVKTDVPVLTQTWARVTLDFDYTAKRCQVSVNGVAANSSAGYVKSSGNTTGGSWYPVISSSASKLTELSFVGSTKVDDLLISESASAIAQNFTGEVTVGGVTVPYDYLATYSIKPNPEAVGTIVSGSGLTVAQKYETGLDPTDDSKFIATEFSAQDGNLLITVPCVDTSARTYTVAFSKDGASYEDAVPASAGGIISGSRQLTVAAPNGDYKVLKIKVIATKN